MNSHKKLLWRMRDDKTYLTFDDGPDREITPHILDLLAQHRASATFFVVGVKAHQMPDIVQRIALEGHRIGNHSLTHQLLLFKKKTELAQEVLASEEILAGITGDRPHLFRPPFGRFGPGLWRILKENQYSLTLWNHSTADYRIGASSAAILKGLRHASPGAIILLHDGHPNSRVTLDALQQFLSTGHARAQKFEALPARP